MVRLVLPTDIVTTRLHVSFTSASRCIPDALGVIIIFLFETSSLSLIVARTSRYFASEKAQEASLVKLRDTRYSRITSGHHRRGINMNTSLRLTSGVCDGRRPTALSIGLLPSFITWLSPSPSSFRSPHPPCRSFHRCLFFQLPFAIIYFT